MSDRCCPHRTSDMTCPECGAKVRDSEAKCFYCGAKVRREASQQPPAPSPTPRAQTGLPTAVRTDGVAIWALVLGVLGTGIPALIVGIISVMRINASNGRLKGKAMAVWGLVLGAVGTVYTVVLIVVAIIQAVTRNQY